MTAKTSNFTSTIAMNYSIFLVPDHCERQIFQMYDIEQNRNGHPVIFSACQYSVSSGTIPIKQ
jgi:hypothetical protein